MRKDIEAYTQSCPSRQVSQDPRESLEREAPQHIVKYSISPFRRGGNDVIRRLTTTPNGNHWIITAIYCATAWPVAKAIPEATMEEFRRLLDEQIFINYGAILEPTSNNGTTIPYPPRTNGKVENLNGLLDRILTKYLTGNELLLARAIRTNRVRDNFVTKTSFKADDWVLVRNGAPQSTNLSRSALTKSFQPIHLVLMHLQSLTDVCSALCSMDLAFWKRM